MGKKPAQQKMSLTELNSKFGGDAASSMLPSQSEGKDFGKAKGKGLRDFEGGRNELDDWRTPGGRKGGGKGKGDDTPSRSDTGDWFSKDRPAGGDRGGFGGGGGGDRGGFGRRDDRREDNTQAGKDDDWRSGMGSRGGDRGGDDREGGRGFGRSRTEGFGGGRGGDDDWRGGGGGGGGGASERKPLNLKPRSQPDGAREEAGGGDSKAATSAPGKYVPPGQRQKMEEDDKLKAERRAADDERREREQDRRSKEEEEKDRRRAEVQRKKAAEEDKRRQEMEAIEEKKRRAEEEKAAVAKARKQELQAQKEAEAKERREAIQQASKMKKASAKGVNDDQECDDEKVAVFRSKCEDAVNEDGDVEELVEKVPDLLGKEELKTVKPVTALLELLLQRCRGMQDAGVIDIVARFAPLLRCLIDSSKMHRFKVKVLIEAQRIAYKMGLPRLSPASALLEVFYDGLYRAEVVEEDYFEWWAISNDDTPGKTSAMFQVTFFLEWLRTAKLPGEESSDEEEEHGEGEEEEDEDDDEEEDDDIEENVPKARQGMKR
eukprot:TRINITY_DN8112_c0_g3_i1.p1 TRINITY_DN8112_c0_g3~~TRINITY_DN8112_c0_g3_i1.p1  ORF type:complete len:546 (-),score=167.43 TRINITY_DN8112_c0_g3_i1:109-1746(-)